MIDQKLPTHCYSARHLNSVNGLIIHYFSAIKVEPDNPYDMTVCRNLFLDLNVDKSDREFYLKSKSDSDKRFYASAHVLIGRDGEEWLLVPFSRRAFHAGRSVLNGQKHCNNFTIGVELVGTVNSGFTDKQYERLAELSADLMEVHKFDLNSIKGHDEVRWNAIQQGLSNKKKYDPSGRYDGRGDNFDWERFYELVRDLGKQ